MPYPLSDADALHRRWNPAEPLALFEWQGARFLSPLTPLHVRNVRGRIRLLVW